MISLKRLETKLPENYKTFNGVVMTKLEVKNYNKLTENINCYLKLGKDAPEHLYDSRNKYFQMICMVGKND